MYFGLVSIGLKKGDQLKMGVDSELKKQLVKTLSIFYDSLPVYSITKLSDTEVEKRAKYYASRFMGGESYLFSRSFQAYEDSKLMNLPWDTKMRIYHKSNTVIINRKLNPFEYLFKQKFDKKQLSEMVINAMEKLQLDKWKLSFEQTQFEDLLLFKAGGIREEKTAPEILCRIVGTFRRHINKIPVYGGPSIFAKIAGDGLLQSVGVDWREINEKPISEERIIQPDMAAEKIIKNINPSLPNQILSTKDFEPEFFALGYYSLPKRQEQKFMQPVYVAIFKSVGLSTLNTIIVVPATNRDYEPVQVAPERPLSIKRKNG
jgi:hypothetical protein